MLRWEAEVTYSHVAFALLLVLPLGASTLLRNFLFPGEVSAATDSLAVTSTMLVLSMVVFRFGDSTPTFDFVFVFGGGDLAT